jgi:hypothetical protein
MPTLPDDKPIQPEQFENYLRLFDPLPPERLHLAPTRTHWLPKTSPLWAAVAALVLIAALMSYPRTRSTSRPNLFSAVDATRDQRMPLTLHTANALLNQAPSFKDAVDALSMPVRETNFTSRQSAFSVLSKDAKL